MTTACETLEAYNALRAEFEEARAEARACGYEFPSFEEWAGMTSAKAEAQERIGDMWDVQDRQEW